MCLGSLQLQRAILLSLTALTYTFGSHVLQRIVELEKSVTELDQAQGRFKQQAQAMKRMLTTAKDEKEKISREKEAEMEVLKKSLNEQTERATKEKADLQAEMSRLRTGGDQTERLLKEKAELQSELARLKALETQVNQLTASNLKALADLKEVGFM